MNIEEINNIVEQFNKSDIAKLKIKKEKFTIELEKESKHVTVAPAIETAPQVVHTTPAAVTLPTPVETVTQDKDTSNSLYIKSPMVGTFYEAPSPDSPAFVKIGDSVRRGEKVAIVEAMKIMNELEAEYDCEIVDILVENGQVVDYDMPLFKIKKL